MEVISSQGGVTDQGDTIMNRKVFDKLASLAGVLIVVILAAAGVLLVVGASFANNEVHNQLAQQEVYFPPASAFAHPTGHEVRATMIPYLSQYAGQEVLTGAQAHAYATHFIRIHLSEMPYGGVYAKVSGAAIAKPTTASLQALVQTSFRGTTLRAELLEAYGFSVFGEIASIGAIVSFILAGLMALLVGLGVIHARRTDETAPIFGGKGHPEATPERELVTV
jgi:hypothetical protein